MSTHSSSTLPRWLLPTLALSALVLVIVIALGLVGGPEKVEPGEQPVTGAAVPPQVPLFTVRQEVAAHSQAWQGTVRSRSVARIAPTLQARILEVRVHPGDHIDAGDVIARLDDRDLKAAHQAATAAQAAAQAQATQASAEEKRTRGLYEQQAATRQAYDAVVAQAQAARALASQAASTARQTQVMLGENRLLAPFAGVIAERLKEPGDMGSPNEAVVTLYKADDLRLEAAIASHCLRELETGMPVKVKLDGLDSEIGGKIDEIAPDIDPKTHTQWVKVKLPASGLRHGQFGELQLSCQTEQAALLIPVSAVLHYGQLQAVKVVVDGQLHTRHIRTGKISDDRIEVLSGLHDGDTILADSRLAL